MANYPINIDHAEHYIINRQINMIKLVADNDKNITTPLISKVFLSNPKIPTMRYIPY